MKDLALGIDVGTSGVRVAAIDPAGRVVASAASAMPAPLRDGFRITQDPAVWGSALDEAMARLAAAVDLARIGALAVDGTSGTLVAIDALGQPVAAGSLYNDRADDAAVAAVGRVASVRAAVHGGVEPGAQIDRTGDAVLSQPGAAFGQHLGEGARAHPVPLGQCRQQPAPETGVTHELEHAVGIEHAARAAQMPLELLQKKLEPGCGRPPLQPGRAHLVALAAFTNRFLEIR